ncbi:unnamed protein product [Bursaphelenchus xylophilus]|uniref:(pine wood nematode) hypothetical protein n=1 Tax=Bursaphelenchus xylophilus TaxID=6326 RepID=A0A1I7RYJ1_BURXY|nr:unnamed protein product [Bursaphelenchus xylophilus]CAG9092630.1 unnamed protein product [Bursaphelenchus xylophilus]
MSGRASNQAPARYRLRETPKPSSRLQHYDPTPSKSSQSRPIRMPATISYQRPQNTTTTRVYMSAIPVDQMNEEVVEEEVVAYDPDDYADYPQPREYPMSIGTLAATYPYNELTKFLKSNLKRLKNVLHYPRSRLWVISEFFYSAVDRQIFLDENEFVQLIQDTFPNLKTFKLRLSEWREIRRLIGKPRRFSQSFLDEERRALNYKRKKIRQLYSGQCCRLPPDNDLPKRLPRQYVVGCKVFARIRHPKEGIYAGTIDAILNEGYRVVFEKEEMIPPSVVQDTEVMPETPPELLNISYFLEMNNANNSKNYSYLHNPLTKPTFVVDPRQHRVVSMVGGPNQTPTFSFQARPAVGPRDDKVGNFPLRMLVIMVKLFKVLSHKQTLIMNLKLMNDRAERLQMVSNKYPITFQERYAEILTELELANRLLDSYLNGIEEYNELLVTNLNEPLPSDKPDQLRKHSQAHSAQIVKHCNASLHVKNKDVLGLISRLTAILLQIRQLGQNRNQHSNYELNVMAESLNQLKATVHPRNIGIFQDCVEIHMKQIFLMMNKGKSFV